jgi:hypothetical protein
MHFSILARLGVTAWLSVMAWQDVKRRRLPHWGTTIPLAALACYHAGWGVGRWLAAGWTPAIADGLAAGLAFLAVLLSDSWWASLPAAGALALAFAQGATAGQTIAVAWLVALALAKAGIVGEGDAKVAMVSFALYPDPLLGACLLGACLLAGGIALARRLGRAAPVLVRLTLRDGLAGRFPARTGDTGVLVVPLAPVLAVGALVYLWLVLSFVEGPLWLLR